MRNSEELERENVALRNLLSRLSEASLRINESLDFETVLQGRWTPPAPLSGRAGACAALMSSSSPLRPPRTAPAVTS